MNDFEEKVESREVETLRALPRDREPPVELEQRVVDALRTAQLIRSPRMVWKRRFLKPGLAVAASIVLFVTGLGAGIWWKSSAQANQTPAPDFILVLRNSPRELSAGEQLARVREYGAWAQKLSQEGRVVSGAKLTDEIRSLNVRDGRPVILNSAAEAETTAVAGYFLIRARDYEEAMKIAEGCPHAKYGGTIEVRQIDRTGARGNSR